MYTKLAVVVVLATLICGLTLGLTQEKIAEIRSDAYNCFAAHAIEKIQKCPDYPKAIQCLKVIKANKPGSSSIVEPTINYLTRRMPQAVCPELRRINTCVTKGKNDCTERVFKNNELTNGCAYVKEAINCLKNMDRICANEEITIALERMHGIESRCKQSGRINF